MSFNHGQSYFKDHTVTLTLSPIFCTRLSKRVKTTCQFLHVCLIRLPVPNDGKGGNNQLKFVRRQREDKYPASNAATVDNVSSRSHYARLQVVLISQKVVLG